MKFDVLWDPDAEKDLDNLPRDIAKRIVFKIRLVGETGRGIEPLHGHRFGFKVRIGDYRTLVDIEFNPNKIFVRVVGHRGNIYKKK